MVDSRPGARQNACKACTKAKRACDRQTPQCGRCTDRQLDCQYFTRSRRSKTALLMPRPPPPGLPQLYPGRPTVDTSYQRASMPDSPVAGRAQPTIASVVSLPSPVLPNLCDHHKTDSDSTESQMVTSKASSPSSEPEFSWFLSQASWHVVHGVIAMAADPTWPSCLFRKYVKTVRGWLQDWAAHGHNIFIHRYLYQSGLPSCLEDAYTTLHAYLAKTEETEDMVLQIVENRATNLCQQSFLLQGFEILDTKAHLARTQALLVYTFIRLFDGCPRQRALAEGTFLTLYEWCQQMRDAAAAEVPRLHDELRLLQADGDQVELAVWKAWILSESLRRTWLLVSATLNAYQTRRDGCAVCYGFLMFTVRQGLWEAPDAWRWAQLVRKQNPLFTQSGDLPKLMEKTPPGEMDTFTNQILSIMLSPEQIDRWVARTAKAGG